MKAAFRVSPELLDCAESLEKKETQLDGMELDIRKHERRLQFSQDLQLEFINGAVQVIMEIV